MTFVKICGITNLEDALEAADAGADYLGFNFCRASPRYIEPKTARKIISELPPRTLTVGVFVNEKTPADVLRIVDIAGVEAVQLHGDESSEYCRQLKDRYVIKALSVNADFDVQSMVEFDVDAVLLDGFDQQVRGGTGKVFDWTVAKDAQKLILMLFLAGGLSPENVSEAIDIVQPYAVDVCSSIEREPGKKDIRRMKLFIERARRAG